MILRTETYVLLKNNLALVVCHYDHDNRRYAGRTINGVFHSFTLWDIKEVISVGDFYN